MNEPHITIVMVWGAGLAIGVSLGVVWAVLRYRRRVKDRNITDADALEFRNYEND